ncbi:MAG: hypothetical protein ABIJ92_02405 [Candidatus Aenigmatarchaeota archaeon]
MAKQRALFDSQMLFVLGLPGWLIVGVVFLMFLPYTSMVSGGITLYIVTFTLTWAAIYSGLLTVTTLNALSRLSPAKK